MKNLLTIIFFVVIFGGVLLFGWWMLRWQFSSADSMLDKWLSQNEYTLIEKQDANVGDGPKGTRQSAKFVKYRIKVKDSAGNIKTGIITLGDENTGVLSDKVEINWD